MPLRDHVNRQPRARVEPHRRRMLRPLALFAVLVVLCAGCDWTMFGYGPAHTSFNPTESAISVANVPGLVQRYPTNDFSNALGCSGDASQARCSSPAVAQGLVYVGTRSNLVARDAGTGSLQWSGHTGATISSSPAVVDGVVYVGSDDYKLYAFDAAGVTNCSGSPKTCAPLWTANTAGPPSSPTVANGVVYVGAADNIAGSQGNRLYAFSAAGTTNCSGSPKVCSPLWTAVLSDSAVGTPAIADGVVYISAGVLYAFDAAGTTSCSGSPKVCTPLWTGTPGTGGVRSSPAVANGVVYAGSQDFASGGVHKLAAFSAAGTTNCSGSPKVCTPLWTATVSNDAETAPAIANGVVYLSVGPQDIAFGEEGRLYAFDAAGGTHCSGSPKTCTPLWTATQPDTWWVQSPAVANGVVYLTYFGAKDLFGGFAGIRAFDATGTINCSGTPKTCSHLWSVVANPFQWFPTVSSPVVANGAVYVNSETIYKFALPS